MNQLHDLINRLRAGESERRIAQDLRVSRPTVHKYKLWAAERGYLDPAQPLPDLATLLAALGPTRQPPQMTSSLADYQTYVEQLLAQGVEMTAIWQRLREVYDYQGSYSAVRRLVQRLQPAEPTAFVRVQCEPGEEMQVAPSTSLRAGFWQRRSVIRPGQWPAAPGLRLCGHLELQPPSIRRVGF